MWKNRLRSPNKIGSEWHEACDGWTSIGPAWEPYHGPASRHRRPVGADRALASPPTAAPAPRSPRTTAHRRPEGVDRYPLCPPDRDQLGGLAVGDGLRLRNDLLAPPAGLDRDGRLARTVRG